MGDMRIFGAKGGGEQSARTPVEAPDSLQSLATARVLILMGLGQFAGPEGDLLQSIYMDGVPIKGVDGTLNVERVTAEWRSGTQNQDRIEGFSEIETEYGVGVEVKTTTPATRQIDDLDADAVRVTVSVPALLAVNASNGDTNPTSVQLAVDLKPAIGAWAEARRITISGKTRSKYQRSVRIPLDGVGPWQIRVRRITADSATQKLQNTTTWDSYTVINDAPLRYPNYALLGLRFDAKAFSSFPKIEVRWKLAVLQVPSNYDPATRSYSGPWSGTFKPAWSDNPAWWLWTYATDSRYNVNIPPGAWKWDLYRIAQWCDQLVSDGHGGTRPRFTCNFIQSESVDAWKVLQDIASVFCGRVIPFAGGVRVTADIPGDVPAKHFMPANVKEGRFTYSSTELADRQTVAVVSFVDPDDGDKRATEYVEHAEGLALYGYQPAEVAAVGCTNRAQAQQLGRYILETAQGEAEMVSFDTGTYGMDLMPGELFYVSDPSVAGGRFAGRLMGVDGVKVELDAPVSLAVGVGYSLEVPMPDGSLARRGVTNGAGTTASLELVAPFPDQPVEGTTWLLVATNVQPTLWRCVRNAESKDNPGEREISGVQHDPNKWARIEQGIRIDPPPVSLLPDPGRIDAVSVITLREVSYLCPDGTRAVRLDVDWPALSHPYLRGYVVGIRQAGGDWRELPEQSANHAEIPDIAPGDWQVRVAAVSVTGLRSIPTVSDIAAEGHTAPPPAPTFSATGGAMRVDFTIAWPSPDCVRAELYGSGNAGDPNPPKLADLAYPTTTWSQLGVSTGVTLYYWLRVIDTWGNASAFATASATTVKDPSLLLEQLQGSVSNEALAEDLRTPIERIPVIEGEIIPAIELRATNIETRATAIESIATLAVDAAALAGESALGLLAKLDGALDQLRREGAITDATVEVDPVTGQIRLKAVAEITTDVEARLNQLGFSLDAINGTIAAANLQVTDHAGRITAAESTITQLSDQITQKVDAVYVDSRLAGVDGAVQDNSAALDALGEAALKGVLADDAVRDLVRGNRASVAQAQRDLQANADSLAAEAVDRLQLAALVEQQAAALVQESSARATKDEALTQQVTTLQAESAANAAAVQSESTARVNADTALGQRVDTVVAQAGATEAGLQSEQTARVDADEALGQRIDTVQAKADSNAAAIQTEQSARANADGALGSRIDTVQAKADSNTAALQTEQSARANADSALGTRIDTVQAKADGNAAAIQAEQQARADGDAAVVSSVTTLQSKVDVTGAAVDALGEAALKGVINDDTARDVQRISAAQAKQKLATLATDQAAQAEYALQLAAQLADQAAALVQEATTRADTVSALSKLITTLQAQSAGNEAAIQQEGTARADAVGAVSQQVTTLQSTVDGNTASIQSQATSINGLKAQYVLKVGAGGKLASWGAYADANGSAFDFLADRFSVSKPDGTGSRQVFTVGSINGTPLVGIAGDLVLDGAMSARHISADAAKFVLLQAKSVWADNAYIGSLSELSNNLGITVKGKLQNHVDAAQATAFIDLSATGTAPFLLVKQLGVQQVLIRADGSAEFARTVVSAPNIVANGTVGVNSGWMGYDSYSNESGSWIASTPASGEWTCLIDTGISVDATWAQAVSDQYSATATISGGSSRYGGFTGTSSAEICIGDGLETSHAGYTDNRVYILFRFRLPPYSLIGTDRKISITQLAWKLVRL